MCPAWTSPEIRTVPVGHATRQAVLQSSPSRRARSNRTSHETSKLRRSNRRSGPPVVHRRRIARQHPPRPSEALPPADHRTHCHAAPDSRSPAPHSRQGRKPQHAPNARITPPSAAPPASAAGGIPLPPPTLRPRRGEPRCAAWGSSAPPRTAGEEEASVRRHLGLSPVRARALPRLTRTARLQRAPDVRRRERHGIHAHTDRVVDRVRDGRDRRV
jgi:hypothetical protein